LVEEIQRLQQERDPSPDTQQRLQDLMGQLEALRRSDPACGNSLQNISRAAASNETKGDGS
jgi:hypothetical protein